MELKYHEKTYFCQPQLGKGLVEQINGLIRRFLPKKTDLSKITKKEIGGIEFLLNLRPRKLLKWGNASRDFCSESGIKLVGGALLLERGNFKNRFRSKDGYSHKSVF